VVGASAAATTAELRGCLPRRAAPGGLQRLRHPTSPAILHRACASKAAHTPPPILSLSLSLPHFLPLPPSSPFLLSFLFSLPYFTPRRSRLASRLVSPR
jgi:hypothetical protein